MHVVQRMSRVEVRKRCVAFPKTAEPYVLSDVLQHLDGQGRPGIRSGRRCNVLYAEFVCIV